MKTFVGLAIGIRILVLIPVLVRSACHQCFVCLTALWVMTWCWSTFGEFSFSRHTVGVPLTHNMRLLSFIGGQVVTIAILWPFFP